MWLNEACSFHKTFLFLEVSNLQEYQEYMYLEISSISFSTTPSLQSFYDNLVYDSQMVSKGKKCQYKLDPFLKCLLSHWSLTDIKRVQCRTAIWTMTNQCLYISCYGHLLFNFVSDCDYHHLSILYPAVENPHSICSHIVSINGSDFFYFRIPTWF